MAEPNSDVKLAIKTIIDKRPRYNMLEAYYEGNQPQVYLTERMRDIFAGVDTDFSQNWCAVVIDACKERINLHGFSSENETIKTQLESEWKKLDLQLEADDVHNYALVFGEAYLIVWPNEENPDELDAYFNDPRICHVFYRKDRPRVPRFAAKLFEREDGTGALTLYYDDHIETWVTSKKYREIDENTTFLPEEGDGTTWPANDYEQIPVFHFRIDRKGHSDLKSVISQQNGVNKLLADMMVAAEYGAFKQRYIISDSEVQGKLSSEPGGLWDLPAGDGTGQGTAVGEFTSTELQNYLNAVNQLATGIGIITRTPKHYFYTQGGDPSGESLIAMEAPLNKKAQDRIDRFTPVWRQVASFILKIRNVAVDDPTLITPNFDKPETVQPLTRAQITKTYTDAQVPLKTALRWEGRDEADIEQMAKDKQEQDAAQQKTLAQAVLDQQRSFDQGGQQPGKAMDGKQPGQMMGGKPNAANTGK